MTLVIQIALGIVLAFLILAFLRQILAVGLGVLLLGIVALGGAWLWTNKETAMDIGVSLLLMGGVALGAIAVILTLQTAWNKLGVSLRAYRQKHAKPFKRTITPKMRETRTRLGYDD